MTAYVIVDIEVHDETLMRQYVEPAEALVAQYGGRLLARSNAPVSQEGEWRPKTVALFAFPSEADAHALYESPTYQSLKAMRLKAATARGIVVVNGVDADL